MCAISFGMGDVSSPAGNAGTLAEEDHPGEQGKTTPLYTLAHLWTLSPVLPSVNPSPASPA